MNYKGKVRVRTGALIVKGEALLLVKLQSPARSGPVWLPPGGAVKAGETLEVALKREVREETGLFIKSGRLSIIHEFIEQPFHAVEFYFVCEVTGGELKLGRDPERNDEHQILLDLDFVPFEKLQQMEHVHPQNLRKHADLLTSPAGEAEHIQTLGNPPKKK